MFTEISMKNFKSWRDTGPVRMAPLTAFFGANSSGKSGMLQMLLLLKQTAESNDRNLVLKTGSMQPGYVNLGTPHEITFGDTTEMTLGLVWKPIYRKLLQLKADEPTLIEIGATEFQTCIYADKEEVYVESLRYITENDKKVSLTRLAKDQYALKVELHGWDKPLFDHIRKDYLKPVKCYGLPRLHSIDPNTMDNVAEAESELEGLLECHYYLGPLREYPRREYTWGGEAPSDVGQKGELTIPALLAAKDQEVYPFPPESEEFTLQTRIAQWLVDLNLAVSLRLEQLAEGSPLHLVKVKRHENSPEVLLSDMGIGVSQVLPVLTLCYYVPKGSTIILEHPELHLHPAVQAGLADVFIDVIKHRNVQLIVESHSEHLLRRLQLRVAEEKLMPDDTALYFCEMRDGESKLTELDVDLFGAIHNWPEDFFGNMAIDVVKTVKSGLNRQIEQQRAT